MKIRSIYPFFVAFLFLMLFFSPVGAAPVKTVQGTVTGQVICTFEWVHDPAYQGSKAVCPNANHDRSLIAKNGVIYALEPADDAGKDVIDMIRTRDYERKNVQVEGEILDQGPVKIIKVKKFKEVK